jgi:hypothetical protein
LIALIAGSILVGCSQAPLPAVKNAYGGSGHDNYYPWQTKNLYRHSVLHTDSTKVPKGFSAQPLCIGRQSYLVPTSNGGVIEIITDSLHWLFLASQFGDSSSVNALAADSVGNVIGTTQHSLFCLDAQGRLQWHDSLTPIADPSSSISSPLLLNGKIFCCSGGGTIWCTDEKGQVLWQDHKDQNLLTQITATTGGDVAVVYTRGEFRHTDSVALYDPSGKMKWVEEIPATRILQGPVMSGSTVVVAGTRDSADVRKGVVTAFDLNGKRLHETSVEIIPTGLSADNEGNVYVSGSSLDVQDIRSVVAQIDAAGAQRWAVTIDGLLGCSVAVTKKYIYFPVATSGVRMLYQLSHEGKTEEVEGLPAIAYTPFTPIIDVIDRVVLPNRYGSQLFVFESDIVGKIF